jgi:hypothetical protein
VPIRGCVFAVLLLISAAVFCGPLGCAAAQPRSEIAVAADGFMTALKAGDYEAAFAMLHTGLRSELGDQAGLRQTVEQAGCRPLTWEFTDAAADPSEAHMPVGTITGTVAYSSQRQGTVVLYMVRLDGRWQVYSAVLK